MADALLGLRLLRILDTSPDGRLTPRETIRRLGMNYSSDYFPNVSTTQLRKIFQSDSEEGHLFFQHVRDVRMNRAYHGLVAFISPRGHLEGRWFVTQLGRDWLARVWRGDGMGGASIRLPPRRADWRDQAPVANVGLGDPRGGVIDLDMLDPRDFEDLLGAILQRMGWRATLTRYSQDGGIDIDAINPGLNVGGRVLVQCKRRRGSIGVATV